MQTEDTPIDRTSDLVARIRALREQAEKEMNRFTRPEDYAVSRLVGQKQRAEEDTTDAPPAARAGRKKRAKPPANQAAMDFASADEATEGEDS